MTPDEYKDLKEGDIIRHILHSEAYVIVGRINDDLYAARIITVTHPNEWELIAKSAYEE